MSEVTLTLKDVESKDVNTKRGLSTVYRLKGSDGRTYTTFDRELAVKASELRGKTVTFDYVESQNGDYTNYNLNGVKEAVGIIENNTFSGDPGVAVDLRGDEAVNIAPASSTSLTANNGIRGVSFGPTTSTDKDTSIARAVALKAAVETVSSGDVLIEEPSEVLEIANVYVDWLLNGPAASEEKDEADTSNLVPF